MAQKDLEIDIFLWDITKAFGGLRRGEKFTIDKAVVLRTEARGNCCQLASGLSIHDS